MPLVWVRLIPRPKLFLSFAVDKGKGEHCLIVFNEPNAPLWGRTGTNVSNAAHAALSTKPCHMMF
jgi:hypothetical protein